MINIRKSALIVIAIALIILVHKYKLAAVESKLNIAVFNSPRYHFEVVYPFLETFRQLGQSTELYASDYGLRRFDFADMIHNTEVKDIQRINLAEVNLLILISCPEDLEFLGDQIYSYHGTIHCVVHEPYELIKEETNMYSVGLKYMRELFKSEKLTLVVLSPHVAKHMQGQECRQVLLGEHAPQIITYIPVARYGTSDPQRYIVTAGKFEEWRRSYNTLINDFIAIGSNDIQLHLIGSGQLHSEAIQKSADRIGIVAESSFRDYYQHISKALALVPAFASDHYVISKASSSISTAVSVGIPIFVSTEIMEAYTYLNSESVYTHESLREGIEALDEYQRNIEKRQHMVKLRENIVQQNHKLYQHIILAIKRQKPY
ncbi:hypothetical protein CANCADRAFT_3736 [Tortispora caseinolytica NRRL Y-17796]|uniref:Glycosyltransferase family 1 protein n=1 Tax=Tortispora caseinolytica NRRL Y-17796 TaxID=767744 RepID=A0A1E4TBH1_9ASCO|nr:hypothetical protein CANCADRAFT_3736 [Tortispora caseinolytica NRRL Y-17796]